jgi:hypothetical protein
MNWQNIYIYIYIYIYLPSRGLNCTLSIQRKKVYYTVFLPSSAVMKSSRKAQVFFSRTLCKYEAKYEALLQCCRCSTKMSVNPQRYSGIFWKILHDDHVCITAVVVSRILHHDMLREKKWHRIINCPWITALACVHHSQEVKVRRQCFSPKISHSACDE